MSIKGWSTQEKDDRLVPQYATVEPVRELQNALSVLSHEFVREVGTDAVEANSTTILINATGHAAKVGDVIRITSGTLSGQEVKVYSVATNSITLAEELASAPALGVTFQILRHKYPVVEATGEVKVTGSFTEVATAADGGALPALTKVVSGYDGSAVQVLKTDAAGELQVDIQSITGTVDASNTTTVALAGGAVFTGSWVENKNYAAIALGIKADQNSATDGLEMQFSNDGSTVHHSHYYTYLTASGGIGYSFQPEFRYYRVKFTNGAVAQSSFTLSTTTRHVPVFPSQYRVNHTITGESQVLLTRGVITGETTGGGGGFVNVKVNPSGALVTEASIASIADVDGQKTMALSFPVVIASDQSAVPASQSGTWNINNVSGTISLPTGAATAARQDTGNNYLQTIDIDTGIIRSAVTTNGATSNAEVMQIGGSTGSSTYILKVDSSGVLQVGDNGSSLTVDGTVSANQSGTWNINNISGTVSLPTGAATESTLSTLNSTTIPNRLPTTGTKTMSGSVSVTLASNQTAMPIYYAGRSAANRARIDYTSTSVTTAAYTQLLASTSAAINEVEIFDSSGQTLVLATGAAGAEADQVYIFPGGNGRIPLAIAATTRVAIKAVSATANAGEISVNFYS
jgi:hypothetical protein